MLMTQNPRSLSPNENALVTEVLRELVKEHRGQSALARAMIAKGIQITQPAISAVILGKSNAGYSLARSVADFKRVPVEQLLGQPARHHETPDNDDISGPRWRSLSWWPDVLKEAKKRFPKVAPVAWDWIGNLMGSDPPPADPQMIGTMAQAWDNSASDDERARAISENAHREMDEEDAEAEDLFKRRHEAREKGEPVPPMLEQLPPPPRPAKPRS